MKKSFLMVSVFLILLYLLSSCITAIQTVPTVEPTQISTKTIETVSPTLTPTIALTLSFYSVEPTVIATAEGCNPFPDRICVPALNIVLSGNKLDAYEVTISYPGFSGASFDCPQQALLVSFGENMAPVICNSDEITLISVGLTELTVTINWDSGSVTETLYPTFEVSAPQGKDCEPQCTVGKVEIKIP